MNLKERIGRLLSIGYPASAVASAVGCSPSYVSQLLSDPEFASSVLDSRAAKEDRACSIDDSYEDIEDKLLKKLGDMLAYINRPAEVLATLKMIHGRPRSPTQIPAPVANQDIVSLQLPAHMFKNLTLTVEKDAQNQIVSIEGHSIATLPSSSLASLASQHKASERERLLEGLGWPIKENKELQNAA